MYTRKRESRICSQEDLHQIINPMITQSKTRDLRDPITVCPHLVLLDLCSSTKLYLPLKPKPSAGFACPDHWWPGLVLLRFWAAGAILFRTELVGAQP